MWTFVYNETLLSMADLATNETPPSIRDWLASETLLSMMGLWTNEKLLSIADLRELLSFVAASITLVSTTAAE